MIEQYSDKHKRSLKKVGTKAQRALWFLLGCIERLANRWFVSYHLRPIYSRDFKTDPAPQMERMGDYSEFAVVVQGPLLHDYQFTLETVRLYRRWFPGAHVVLSTWDWNERDRELARQAETEGVRVILNEKRDGLSTRGATNNFNLQVLSTRSGIESARAVGAKYVLKTRTDQRIHHADALDFFKNLIERFPVDGTYPQKARIIGVNRGKSRLRKYHFPEWLVFGTIEDMDVFWAEDVITDHMRLPYESYLFIEYLKKLGREPQWTVEDSLECFVDHLVLVDLPLIDLYWRKYDFHREYRFPWYYARVSRNFGFVEWLNLYCKRNPLSSPRLPERV